MNAKHIVSVAVTTCHLAACTVMRPLPNTPGPDAVIPVQIGSMVTIHTPDAKTEMVVSRISADQLCSIDHCVPAGQIQTIERKEFSVTRTAAVWVGVALFVVAHFYPYFPWLQ